MSLCGRCVAPGSCCRSFVLNIDGQDKMTALEVMGKLATAHQGPEPYNLGLPFLPLFKQESGFWKVWCPNLGRDGRCLDYDNRPETCRQFEPASDALCIHYGPATVDCPDHIEDPGLCKAEPVECEDD